MKGTGRQYWLALLAVAAAAGCGPEQIDHTYGRRRGSPGAESVNGTAVLASLFRQAGFNVSTWSRLSPRLRNADVIVWAPDNFDPPSAEARRWLEGWVAEQSGRTLIYIGRDYDAESSYWEQVQPMASPEQMVEYRRRLADARSRHATERIAMPKEEFADWFVVRREAPRRSVEALTGPWSKHIDASRTDIQLAGRLDVPNEQQIDAWVQRADHPWVGRPVFEVLLASPAGPIVTRLSLPDWGNSKILCVANGSFLLNLPLVNAEHRRLATRLVEACKPAGKVYLLESGPTGIMILDRDLDAQSPTGLEMFTVWPLGVILLHLAALGVLLALARFPIFGPAREWEVASSSDFGQHVAAVGELLEMSRDSTYALDRIKYYRDHVRRDSGVGHGGKRNIANSPNSPGPESPPAT